MTDWREPLVPALWVAWGLYWWVAARNTKAVARRESALSRLAHLVPLATAAILLAAPALPGWLGRRWSAPRLDVYALGVVLVVAGLLFSVWARVVLGGNWSASVTLKHGHRIVRAGPYRWVHTRSIRACCSRCSDPRSRAASGVGSSRSRSPPRRSGASLGSRSA